MDFALLVKIKENKKRHKYLDLARELKKLWNMKVIPFVISALRTILKGFVRGLEELEIRGQVKTIQTTALLRSARIQRRVQETCCQSNSSERPSANAGVKNSQLLGIVQEIKTWSYYQMVYAETRILFSEFCCSSRPQSENKRKQKDR